MNDDKHILINNIILWILYGIWIINGMVYMILFCAYFCENWILPKKILKIKLNSSLRQLS